MSGQSFIDGLSETKTPSTPPASLGTQPLRIIGHRNWKDWTEEAECRGYPLSWFFGDSQRERAKHAPVRTHEETRNAKEVCAQCEVRLECLAWALAEGHEDGIYAGYVESELAEMREWVYGDRDRDDRDD